MKTTTEFFFSMVIVIGSGTPGFQSALEIKYSTKREKVHHSSSEGA